MAGRRRSACWYAQCTVCDVYHFSRHCPSLFNSASAACLSRLLSFTACACFIGDLAARQSGLPATAEGTVCTVSLVPVFFLVFVMSGDFFYVLLSVEQLVFAVAVVEPSEGG